MFFLEGVKRCIYEGLEEILTYFTKTQQHLRLLHQSKVLIK